MLGDFCSFFEILAGLNLAYATTKTISDILDKKLKHVIDRQSKTIENKCTELKSKVKVSTGINLVGHQNLEEDIEGIYDEFKENTKEISTVDFEKDLYLNFQSMFLITSLFCFQILLISGFEFYFVCKSTSIRLVWFSIVLLFFYNAIVFLGNSYFINTKLIKCIKRDVFVVVLFLSSIAVSVAYCIVFPINEEFEDGSILTILSLAILASLLPFILRYIKLYLSTRNFKKFMTHFRIASKKLDNKQEIMNRYLGVE